jgi:myo-inositol-1(or 4)-monophosphatase
MKEYIRQAVEANKEIYAYLKKTKDTNLYDSLSKGAGGDITHGIDKYCEDVFIKYLLQFGKIISEECGEIGSGEFEIIIDPLDGSDNFLSKLPYFGSSVAFIKDVKVVGGVVANFAIGDIFIKDNLFLKATFEDLDFKRVDDSFTGKVGIFERGYKDTKLSQKIREVGIKFRTPGALALSLAYANNVAFMMYEGSVREFDVAAGIFMNSNLNIFLDDKVLLVAKDRDIFERLKSIVMEIR